MSSLVISILINNVFWTIDNFFILFLALFNSIENTAGFYTIINSYHLSAFRSHVIISITVTTFYPFIVNINYFICILSNKCIIRICIIIIVTRCYTMKFYINTIFLHISYRITYSHIRTCSKSTKDY